MPPPFLTGSKMSSNRDLPWEMYFFPPAWNLGHRSGIMVQHGEPQLVMLTYNIGVLVSVPAVLPVQFPTQRKQWMMAPTGELWSSSWLHSGPGGLFWLFWLSTSPSLSLPSPFPPPTLGCVCNLGWVTWCLWASISPLILVSFCSFYP